MTVISYGDVEAEVDADWYDGDVWVPVDAVPAAIGWEVKPEGVCFGDTCVPVAPGAHWLSGGRFNLSAFARHLGIAEAADPERELVAFVVPTEGVGPGTVEAPDFTLPDLDGTLHSLSDYRGQKVVLYTWGSF